MEGASVAKDRQIRASQRRWRWAAIILTVLGFGIGCNPITFTGYMLQPFAPNIPPKCKLKLEKDTTIAVAAFYGYLEQRPEYQSVDRELSERLCAALKKRFDDNRERVKIVPASRVYAYMNQSTKTPDPHELGKHFNADYVIALEIQGVSMYERGVRQLFRGNVEAAVTVLDIRQPKGESTVFEEVYRNEFPRNNPIPVDSGNSLGQFRALFLTHVARDLSRWFASYPPEEQREAD